MGVTKTYSTLEEGLTPICNECGVALCWDIHILEYEDDKGFWDEWKCKCCNPQYEGALTRWRIEQHENLSFEN